PPVVIEKIVTDISNISDAAELNGIKVKKVTREGKRLTVKIKKKTGLKYQIRYTAKKNSWKGALKKRFTKSSVSIKGLKSGKKYYFSIRAYKVVDGKKIYGKWSKRQSVR
ncbi:MAG: fibronectin type III domain-containing protein, partial [Eubacterium sp.]|nr:fibronectin type III domain-containing protein [Eubacterium sp.]